MIIVHSISTKIEKETPVHWSENELLTIIYISAVNYFCNARVASFFKFKINYEGKLKKGILLCVELNLYT